MEYDVPTGYYTLCTKNIKTYGQEIIMAYSTIDKGSSFANTALYTGNSSTQAITGLGFQPDLVWIKRRDGTYNH